MCTGKNVPEHDTFASMHTETGVLNKERTSLSLSLFSIISFSPLTYLISLSLFFI